MQKLLLYFNQTALTLLPLGLLCSSTFPDSCCLFLDNFIFTCFWQTFVSNDAATVSTRDALPPTQPPFCGLMPHHFHQSSHSQLLPSLHLYMLLANICLQWCCHCINKRCDTTNPTSILWIDATSFSSVISFTATFIPSSLYAFGKHLSTMMLPLYQQEMHYHQPNLHFVDWCHIIFISHLIHSYFHPFNYLLISYYHPLKYLLISICPFILDSNRATPQQETMWPLPALQHQILVEKGKNLFKTPIAWSLGGRESADTTKVALATTVIGLDPTAR